MRRAAGRVRALLLLFAPFVCLLEDAIAMVDNDNDLSRHRHRKLETRPSSELIEDAYIVLLNDNVSETPEMIAKEYGITRTTGKANSMSLFGKWTN